MGERRFKAFISYSHADEAWGGWLQRSLEGFRAPASLAAKLSADGRAARLAPVFRDREDLPVAGNLNAAIQTALADSEFQIVLCSPSSAKSRWVNEEIKLFHRLRGPGRVFALIIAGEPGASAIAGREAEECFPPALRFQLDENGELTDAPAEPLAADARESGDGKRYALLKVAAGMLGVGLDELVRRDAARRAKAAWAISGASVAGMAGAGALAFVAITKSNEATHMRIEAENLIEFMLTDLKEKLEPVGRLDVLEAVVNRAMDYYADQDPKSLGDDALARRAKAMMQLGTIEFRRNNLDAAQGAYEAAEAATAELLRRSPGDSSRMFDHAQNVFYVGEAAISRGDLLRGETQYREYLRLAQQLVAIDPQKAEWRVELAYATSNLGGAKYYAGEYDSAISYFKASIEARRSLLDHNPGDRKLALDYAYALSWQALAELARGAYATAINLIQAQLRIYGNDADISSTNFKVLDAVVTAQRRLADAYIGSGRLPEARSAISAAAATAQKLLARDDDNANWNVNASIIERTRSYLSQLEGDDAGAALAADLALEYANAACKHGACEETMRSAQALALARRLQSGGDEKATARAAAELARVQAKLLASDSSESLNALASTTLALALYERQAGSSDRASAHFAAALARLEPSQGKLAASDRLALARLYKEAGTPEKADPILAELEKIGVAHPDLIAARLEIQRLAGN